MQTFLLITHIVLAIIMIGLVLIQKSEGGALGMGGGGGGGFMTSRGSANLLTRMTAILATLFFVSTLGLALVFKGAQAPKSFLDTPETPAPISAPVAPSAAPAAPLAPLAPAPSTVAPEAVKSEPVEKKKKSKKKKASPVDTNKAS